MTWVTIFRHISLGTSLTSARRRRQLQAKSVEIVAIMARHSFLAACKILLTELGIENGPVRAPLQNLTNEQRETLLADLHEAEVFDLQRAESVA